MVILKLLKWFIEGTIDFIWPGKEGDEDNPFWFKLILFIIIVLIIVFWFGIEHP